MQVQRDNTEASVAQFPLPFGGALLEGEFVDLVLVGVEGLDGGVAFAEIEDEDFTVHSS